MMYHEFLDRWKPAISLEAQDCFEQELSTMVDEVISDILREQGEYAD